MSTRKPIGIMQMFTRYRAAVMGIAALWVLVLHCWILIIPNRPFLGAIESMVKKNGTLGVEIFLFFSGIGLPYSIRRQPLRMYYAKRFRRVVFPFWVMALLSAVSQHWGITRFLKIASGVAFFTESIHLLLWYVPAIALLYAVYPAYHRLMVRARDEVGFTLCALGIWLCASMFLRDTMREDVWCLTNRLPSILLGICLGEMGQKRDLEMKPLHWLLCVLSFAAGWMLRSAANQGRISLFPQFYFVPTTLIGVSLCFLFSGFFAWLEAAGGWMKRLCMLMIRPLSWIGAFSLELYCVHQWLFGFTYGMLEGRVSYLVINMINMPLMVFAGWALWKAHGLFWKTADRLLKRA